MSVALLFISASCAQRAADLYVSFIRPEKNPLEAYPVTHAPLCIANAMPGFEAYNPQKCNRRLMTTFQIAPSASETWCTTTLKSTEREKLAQYLNRDYELGFNSGYKFATTRMGPNNWSVYTHYEFTYINKKTSFALHRVVGSSPVNISQDEIMFSYAINYVEHERESGAHPVIAKFAIIWYAVLVVLLFIVINPNLCGRSTVTVLATIPSHNFLIVVLSGAGGGAFVFVLTILLLNWFKIEWFRSWWVALSIPDAVSAIATGIITSAICSHLRLRDVASALYFAPLIFPAITLIFIFSIQWIPVCVDSCLTIPMKGIFTFIITSVFVKLPLNLVSGLITGSSCRAKSHSTLYSITTRKFCSSRKLFLTLTNFMLFMIAYPLVKHVIEGYKSGIDQYDWKVTIVYFPLWALASTCIGIASLGMADAVDWGIFSFMSVAGSGIVLWLVMLLKATFSGNMSGTLQVSMHAAVTGLLSVGLSLSAGCLSFLAGVIWMTTTGVPSKAA